MCFHSSMKRCVCVHGHFYQPPRENPWTGTVERQPSAGRDHDWNARIARECYIPNGETRVMDGSGLIADLVDNYEWMSFDFGPTLLAWLETAHPHAHARLIEADRRSAQRLGGHGNAMAQSFHHTILPLAHPRDRVTEVRWGLADFAHRFKRKAEGLWLPECAVDDATLAVLAAEGVKFVLLEPHQAEGVVPDAPPAEKTDADKAADPEKTVVLAPARLAPPVPGVPYLWRGPNGARLAVFFYDGSLSRSIAFEHAMRDSRAFARALSARIPPTAEDGLSIAATDGESYGHHDAFAEMGLAHLLRYALPEAGLEAVNLAWFLSRNRPRREVKLKSGGTSWSCAHGLERWRSDCGCGAEGGRRQAWRAPLRAALDGLRAKLSDLYEDRSKGLLSDPWAARDAYVSVVLDRSDASVEKFLAAHAPGARDEAAKVRALQLLEMQRHALMMYTSCGWFFDELSRLEPVQILLYAARALELARAFGAELEPEFVAALAKAPSNEPAFGDGAGVWAKLVKPNVLTLDHVAAHYAVSLLFEDKPPARAQGRAVRCDRFTRRAEAGVTVTAGRAEFVEETTRERWTRSFFAAVLPGQRVQAYVCGADLAEGSLELLMADAAQGTQKCPLPPGRHFLLRDLRPDEREKVLSLVLKRRLNRWESGALEFLEESLPLVEQFRGLGLPLPPGLGEETRIVFAHALASISARFAEGSAGALEECRALLARGRAAGVEPIGALVEEPWGRGISRLLDELEKDFDEGALRALRDAAAIAGEAGLSDWRPAAQTRFFRLWKACGGASPAAREAASALGIAV
jgi:alpha-amylase/alpha-mannosidase (GH57 family)